MAWLAREGDGRLEIYRDRPFMVGPSYASGGPSGLRGVLGNDFGGLQPGECAEFDITATRKRTIGEREAKRLVDDMAFKPRDEIVQSIAQAIDAALRGELK